MPHQLHPAPREALASNNFEAQRLRRRGSPAAATFGFVVSMSFISAAAGTAAELPRRACALVAVLRPGGDQQAHWRSLDGADGCPLGNLAGREMAGRASASFPRRSPATVMSNTCSAA
jgi:hypothetical protein